MGKNKPTIAKGLMAATILVSACSLAACSPQPVSSEKPSDSAGDGAVTEVSVEWSPEADCGMCHTAEAASREDASCTAALHASTACVVCHADASVLAARHEGVTSEDKMPKRLSKTEVGAETCLSSSCHSSYEELAKRTADYRGLVDEEGTVVNPHDLPASDSHSSLVCVDCHSMHVAEDKPAENAMSKCESCHHEKVFACGTCHSV